LKRGNEKCFIGPVFRTKDDGRVISKHVVRRSNGEGFPDHVVSRGDDEKGFINNVVRKRSSQQYFSEQVGS
jgi:hypothetical protein